MPAQMRVDGAKRLVSLDERKFWGRRNSLLPIRLAAPHVFCAHIWFRSLLIDLLVRLAKKVVHVEKLIEESK